MTALEVNFEVEQKVEEATTFALQSKGNERYLNGHFESLWSQGLNLQNLGIWKWTLRSTHHD